jgi:hypothetical protein
VQHRDLLELDRELRDDRLDGRLGQSGEHLAHLLGVDLLALGARTGTRRTRRPTTGTARGTATRRTPSSATGWGRSGAGGRDRLLAIGCPEAAHPGILARHSSWEVGLRGSRRICGTWATVAPPGRGTEFTGSLRLPRLVATESGSSSLRPTQVAWRALLFAVTAVGSSAGGSRA